MVLAICRAWRRRAPVHSCAALAAWRRMALVINLSTNHGATCLLVGAGWVGPLSRTIAKQLIVAADRWAGLAGAIIHSCAVLTHGRRGANMFAAPAGHWASFFVRCTGVVPREKAVEGALAQDLAFIAG